jgi:hypothetical protein
MSKKCCQKERSKGGMGESRIASRIPRSQAVMTCRNLLMGAGPSMTRRAVMIDGASILMCLQCACAYEILSYCSLLTSTMSRLSKGGIVEYGDSDGLVGRKLKHAQRSLNNDIKGRSVSNMAAQIVGKLCTIAVIFTDILE